MTDNDPWFTTYRGPGLLRIVPRRRQGWYFFGGMIALVILPLPLLLWIALWQAAIWLVPIYLLVVFGVIVWMIRFAWRHSEVIDIGQMARDLKDFRKWRDEMDRHRPH